MLIRTYIDKNNTIIRNTQINTGRNPIAEIYYGGKESVTDYTRHLLYFDIVDLQTRYSAGTLGDLSKVVHTLRMTNSSFFDKDLQAQKLLDGKQRTSSFDLDLFRVNKDWDEGCGYDYQQVLSFESEDNITFVQSASNWLNSTTTTPWDDGGVYSGSPSGITVATQHFDKGNENISMDITDEVNSLITGGTTNYGYGIAFERDLELIIKSPSQYVGFFTRHTQTYFYVNVGGQPTNLDNNPSVTIKDEDGNVFSAITSAQTIQTTTGIYYADVFVPVTEDDCVLFTDTWSDININGISRSDVTLDFEVKSDDEYYNFGDSESLPIEYMVSLSGIKRDEKIKRGDKRKVFVNARLPYTINQSSVIDGLQYRMWIREGTTQVNVIDWEDVNRSFLKNYFVLDTSWLIPNEYYIDIKLTSNELVKTYTTKLKFSVVNQVDNLH